MQGERIHLLLPAAAADRDSVAELVRFSNALTNLVYNRISKSAGKEFRGFKMAADHGRAILVGSAGQSTGSIVSLGPAANAPAKELKRDGEAEHLRIRTRHYSLLGGRTGTGEWVNLQVRTPSQDMAHLASQALLDSFANRSAEYLDEPVQTPLTVGFADAPFLETFSGGYVDRAMKIQGFSLRADLDGFSKEVEAAFRNGNAGIANLVTRFSTIMRYPDEFRKRVGKTVDLPWAGDCATVIVLPNGAGYEDAQEYLPVKAAGEWHSQRGSQNANKRNWAEYVGDAKWAVGIAGGDADEGANGYILVAPIRGRHRDFMVAAGWGIGRSLDAQESDGVRGNDTVIPETDYTSLASTHRPSFRKLNSTFWVSHQLTADSVRNTGAEQLASTTPVYVPNIQTSVPQPRPWSESK